MENNACYITRDSGIKIHKKILLNSWDDQEISSSSTIDAHHFTSYLEAMKVYINL